MKAKKLIITNKTSDITEDKDLLALICKALYSKNGIKKYEDMEGLTSIISSNDKYVCLFKLLKTGTKSFIILNQENVEVANEN